MIPAISNFSLKLLQGLANNNDSIAPMVAKDTISNFAIVNTYKKEGGKYDAAERAIEEFGTGAVWLFGIPALKFLVDKTVYKALGLNPKFDIRNLKGKTEEDIIAMTQNIQQMAKQNPLLENQKQVFENLLENNSVLKNIKNKDLYKGLFVGKFALSTVATAFALRAIIKYKQKMTQKRIEKDYFEKNASKILIKNANKNDVIKQTSFEGFLKKPKNTSKNPSFGNLLSSFMYNPILNTSILDGVITTTRLKEARKGERKEVAHKEIFQIAFIYLIAKPTQFLFEKIGKHFNMPIELSPEVLFDKNLSKDMQEILDEINNLPKDNVKEAVFKLANSNPESKLLNLLYKNEVIKQQDNTISYLAHTDESSIKNTLSHIKDLSENINNLKLIKGYKVLSVLGNVAIGALAMGVLQPKLNILMRKILNKGDNRNQAIAEQEDKFAKFLND